MEEEEVEELNRLNINTLSVSKTREGFSSNFLQKETGNRSSDLVDRGTAS